MRPRSICVAALVTASLVFTARLSLAGSVCVEQKRDTASAAYKAAFDNLLSNSRKGNWSVVGKTCRSCAKRDVYYRYFCAWLAYEKDPQHGASAFLRQIPTDQQGLKSLFSLDEDVLGGGEPSSGLFNTSYPQGFFELFIGKLFPLAYKGNSRAIDRFFRLFAVSDGWYAEDLADRAYQLFRNRPYLVLRSWNYIRPYTPEASLASTDFPQKKEAVIREYEAACSNRPGFAKVCPQVIRFLSSADN